MRTLKTPGIARCIYLSRDERTLFVADNLEGL